MNSIIQHVSPRSNDQRLMSPKQFEILVSTEGHGIGRTPVSLLELNLMYSSLYVSYLDLCKTCQPSSLWTVISNIDFVSRADKFVSELERCIHMGVPRSKTIRDSIVMMIGLGRLDQGYSQDCSQDWDQILDGKFFDWVAYRASCVGNEIIGMTDAMYDSLAEKSHVDLVSSTRDVLLVPLSNLTNVTGFRNDLKLARTSFSVSHRVRSLFREEGSEKRDIARAVESVISEWIVGQM